jgi:hypothetical protein
MHHDINLQMIGSVKSIVSTRAGTSLLQHLNKLALHLGIHVSPSFQAA